jgi:putative sterol carrier protein
MASTQEVEQTFDEMAQRFDPQKVNGVNAVVQFDLSGDSGGLYWLKITETQAESGQGPVENPDMTLRASADDWVSLTRGELNPMNAFMSGKIKVQGDMGLALKLQTML